MAAGPSPALAIPPCGCGTSTRAWSLQPRAMEPAPPPPDYAAKLAGAPPALDAVYERGNELIDAGPEGYEQAIADLKGFPVVVNVWASWCGPCRAEFPHLQNASAELGKRIAFLGLNSDDDNAAAATFLRDHPVPYPSYTDPDKKIAVSIGATHGLPATAFYNREGERILTRHGGYRTEADLLADIRKYSLGDGKSG